MDYKIVRGKPHEQICDCLIVGVQESAELSASAKELDQASGGQISRVIALGDMQGRSGHTVLLHDLPGVKAARLLLVGCGEPGKFKERQFREAVTSAVAALRNSGAKEAVSWLGELDCNGRSDYWKARMSVEACAASQYLFQTTKSKKKPEAGISTLALASAKEEETDDLERAIRDGRAVAAGTELARELGNLPGNICTPTYLAEQAQAIGKRYAALAVTVLEEADMDKLGMGALLSVSRGSREPAKLIVMEYRGGQKTDKPVLLVGKGLTFDAGGISLKPAAEMDEMKFDMCGGASVLGTMHACCELGLALNVVGIIPASENLPDGQANKPGDIVTSMSGQTIEILNTDAEGRLILCDALTYGARFNPEIVVDVATLTGACIIALGQHACGLMGNDQELVTQILAAGEASGDRAWQLPMWEDYQEQLDSNFADVANVGGRPAGSVTAACFLARFTEDYRWAHLDIAGTAWKTGKEKGATGRPVPLLTQLLLGRV